MQARTTAQVHRFRSQVAAYLGCGKTVYMSSKEARKLAKALNAAARDIEQCPSFSGSDLETVTINIFGDRS